MSDDSTRRPRGASLRDAAGGSLAAPLYALAERALNEALRYDPATRARLAAHKGRVLAVECLQPPLRMYFLFTADGVEVYDSCETSVDAGIRAGAFGLLRQLLSANPELAPAGSGVEVSGDTRFVQELVRVARDLDIDWEEPLAQYLGDVAARQVGEVLRGVAGFLRRAGSNLQRDGEDFLRHELALFPSKHAVREFLGDVDELRLDTDRVEARTQQLQQRLDRLAGAKPGAGR